MMYFLISNYRFFCGMMRYYQSRRNGDSHAAECSF